MTAGGRGYCQLHWPPPQEPAGAPQGAVASLAEDEATWLAKVESRRFTSTDWHFGQARP